MSDNGEKLIIPEEKQPTEIILIDLDELGRIRINIKTNNEALLICSLYNVNKAVDNYINQERVKQQHLGIQKQAQSQDLLNRIRGKIK